MSSVTRSSSVRRCEHDSLVRLVLDTLFPKQAAVWRRTSSSIRRQFCAAYHHHRLTSPFLIRNAIAAQLHKIDIDNALFGENVIDVILTRDESSAKRRVNVAQRPSLEDDLAISSELLCALRTILANQRPHHEPFGEIVDGGRSDGGAPPMDRITCERRPLPVLTITFSERYCYHTVYWLCEVLSLICARFTILCNKRRLFPWVPRGAEAIQILLKPNQEQISKFRSASCEIQKKFLVLRERMVAPLCRACVRLMFVRLIDHSWQLFSPQELRRRNNDHRVYDILLGSYVVRLYRKTVTECARSETCERHDDSTDNCLTDDDASSFAISLHLNDVMRPWYLTCDPTTHHFNERNDALVQLSGIARNMAKFIALYDIRGVVNIKAHKGLFVDNCRMLFFMASLFEEPLSLTFVYHQNHSPPAQ